MKKHEVPHRLNVVFKRQNEVRLESFACSCAAGQGLCHHVIGLMYTLAHYQLLGLKSVPPVVSKPSKPQVNFSINWYLFGFFMGLRQAYIWLFQIIAKGFIFSNLLI